MRILIVSSASTPRMKVGAKRFAFIAAHLERRGHEIETIARRIRRHELRDPTLPQPGRTHWIGSIFWHELPGRSLTARVYNRIVIGFLGMPDQEAGWLPPSVIAGRRVCKRFKPDIIIATAPTLTALMIGRLLSKDSGVPLVIDYRDPLTAFDWPDTSRGRLMRSPLRRKLERWVVRSAAAAVFSTQLIRGPFIDSFNKCAPKFLRVITNGFDELVSVEPSAIRANSFNIVYAGSLYGERRISTLLEALEELLVNRGSKETFAVHIFGSIPPGERARIEAIGLGNLLHEHAPVDHQQLVRYLKAADVLFLSSGSDMRYSLPYKTFDYLSVRRPILAVSPPGSAVATLFAEVDCGEVALADERQPIADALERLLGRQGDYSFAGIQEFTWARLAGRYEDLLHEVIANRDSRQSQ